MVVALIASGLLLHFLPEPEQEWLRLGLMALLSTAAAVGVTFVTPPTDPHVLRVFYQQVKPAGWWRATARASGENGARPLQRLRREVLLVVSGSASLLFMLVGLGRLVVQAPGNSVWVSLLYVGIALLAMPFWWPAVARKHLATESRGE